MAPPKSPVEPLTTPGSRSPVRKKGKQKSSRGIRLSDFDKLSPKQPPARPSDAPKRDLVYENTEGVSDVLTALKGGAPAVLAYGGAGVGKSHLVRYLKALPSGSRQVTVAPTAIAALTSNGQTIHSFFQFPPRILDPRNLEDFKGKPSKLWREISLLVIDETSMVRPDLLDSIDARLRQMRNSQDAFGGVQVLLVGDPLQLPPVVREDERDLLHSMGYKTPFLHSSKIWKHIEDLGAVELTRVFRQTEVDFIDALNDIRRYRNISSALAFLNERCLRPHREGGRPVLLTATRRQADTYNAEGLNLLPGPEKVYLGEMQGKLNIQREQLPVMEHLILKPGAEVMAVQNDSAHRWVNGSRGQVVSLEPEAAVVRFYSSGATHKVERHTWEKVKQVWDDKAGRIRNEVEGSYIQLPLVYGWALTIHKAQGMTLDDVRVDLAGGTFASGQLYVAISRAKTLDGLSLSHPLTEGDVKADQILLQFLEWLEANTSAS